jgi:UDP-N-acetylmuramoyl-tripeptide--D-alanyl-D-alanine ligase
MKEFLTADLVRATGATADVSDFASHTPSFTGVSIDSRTTKEGDCFFAILGENFDGHDYVGGALAKGAVCAVVGKEFHNVELAEKCLLRVNDTVEALGDLAREYRRRAGFKVVAITATF